MATEVTITFRQSIVKHAARALCLVTVVALSVAAQTQPQLQTQPPLKSPWDGQHISPSDIPYICPEVPNLPHDFTTTRYYSDPKSSIIDSQLKKIYDDSVAPVRTYSTSLTVAADAYQQSGLGPLQLAHASKIVKHALLGVFAHRAGVKQNQVGVFGAVGRAIALGSAKHIGHFGRVVLVHLAAEGANEQLFHQGISQKLGP